MKDFGIGLLAQGLNAHFQSYLKVRAQVRPTRKESEKGANQSSLNNI
jgi:hypothetical protein